MSASEIDRLRDDERALYEAVPADGGRITSRRSRTDFGSLRPYWPDILSGPIFRAISVTQRSFLSYPVPRLSEIRFSSAKS